MLKSGVPDNNLHRHTHIYGYMYGYINNKEKMGRGDFLFTTLMAKLLGLCTLNISMCPAWIFSIFSKFTMPRIYFQIRVLKGKKESLNNIMI